MTDPMCEIAKENTKPPAHDDAVVAALEVALKWLGPLQQTTSAGMLPTLQREVAQIEQALKKVRSYG